MDVGREFRSDINGMRAWAVMAVVLYHFGIPGISGGFAGVDVFFVISGYLMCGIISSGLERGDFSIWRFYLARARRIFPALIALCLAVLLFNCPEETSQSSIVCGIAGHDLIGEGETFRCDNERNNYLDAIALFFMLLDKYAKICVTQREA